MPWWITDGVLQRADTAPAENSILTKIKIKGKAVIPDGVTEIAAETFRACTSMESITIPGSVARIGKEAFRGCTELMHLLLPDGVKSIGENAFLGCLSLKAIELPDSIQYISEGAFSECRMLTRIFLSENHPHLCLENDLLISKDGTLLWAAPHLDSVTVPEGVTNIGSEVFSGRRSLLSVTLPNSVARIGQSAFCWCEHLQNLSIPDSLTHIGSDAFCCCKSLTSITLPDGITKIGTLAFAHCNRLKTISLPAGLTEIEKSAFDSCDRLREITLPDSLIKIGDSAFENCSALAKLTLPAGLKTIGSNAFRYCLSLTHILLPDGLTSLSEGAFSRCYGLEEIMVPDSVTQIGSGAFARSAHLIISAGHWSLLDRETLKDVKIISCPIPLGESPANLRLKLCIGFALHQDRYPDQLCGEYFMHIKKNAAKLLTAAFEYPELLRLMCREKLIGAKDIDAFTSEAVRREDIELTAVLLSYQAEVLTMDKVSKARERKAKLQEKQDEIITDRIAARANKVGIDGLNFAVTGRLYHFAKRDELKAFITQQGGKLQSTMSTKTDYLITNDTDSGSAKNQKAAEMGIVTITENEFLMLAQGKKKAGDVKGIIMI